MGKNYKIGVIPGDGTGPEVVDQALRVIDAAEGKFGFKTERIPYDFGGDRYLATGEVLPDSAPDELKKLDAILLGAIGHPDVKPGILEKGILLRLRFELDQYVNLRPVKLFPGVKTPLTDKGPEHIETLSDKIAESLVQQLDQQGRDLCESLESQVRPLGDRIVAAATQAADAQGVALRKDLTEACSATTQRAAQRPVIDGLIALLDRICDEREFLTAWYRKDPQLALHLGCRQLHERYDDAVGSFAAEIHMILRSLGVEQIAGCSGPFNPKHQRVVALEMAANPDLDGHVAKIVRAGFTWNGTILRPELVVVFKLERKSDEKEKRR